MVFISKKTNELSQANQINNSLQRQECSMDGQQWITKIKGNISNR